MKNLAQKFIALTEGSPMWPALYGGSPLIQGSGWNTARYFSSAYANNLSFPELVIIRGREGIYFVPEHKFRANAVEIFQKYLTDQNSLKERMERFYQFVDEADDLYDAMTYNAVAKLSGQELKKTLVTARDIIWQGNAYAFFSTFFDKEFCLQQVEEAGIALSPKELEAIWEQSTTPVVSSFDKDQQLDFARLRAMGASWERIVEHCQYFYTSYLDAKDLAAVEEQLQKDYGDVLDPQAAKSLVEQEKGAIEQRIEKFYTWLQTLSLEQQQVAIYTQAVIKLRDNRKNFFFKGLTVIWRIAQRMFNEAGIPERYIFYATFYELQKGVSHVRSIKEDIMTRPEGFAILVPYEGKPYTEHIDYEKVKRELLEHVLSSQQGGASTNNKKELRGQTGAPGKVRGQVKIVLDPRSASHFEEGDILVAGMTRPEYVPLMKKAKAIITDEGGITCHAAIVSREMGLPCVIGTKIATQTLKNGDMVEIDAGRGIIRIIK